MNNYQVMPAGFSGLDFASTQVLDDFQGCPEILASVAVLFRENYPQDLKALQDAVAARDGVTVAFLAHKIRGSVLCFHQESAAAAATALEQKAERNDFTDTDCLLETLIHAFDLVCSTLERAERMLVEQ